MKPSATFLPLAAIARLAALILTPGAAQAAPPGFEWGVTTPVAPSPASPP